MKFNSFEELFLALLSDIYYVENQLVKSLPEMAQKAQSKELKEGINNHLKETKEQVTRLEEIFKLINEKPQQVEWINNMKPVFEAVKNTLNQNSPSPVLDACIIAIAQRVEHFEIATYGTLREFADVMELDEVKEILKETLKEEAHADKLLTKVAEGDTFKAGVNVKASKRG